MNMMASFLSPFPPQNELTKILKTSLQGTQFEVNKFPHEIVNH